MEEKKIYAPFQLIDYRMMRPALFLEKGGSTMLAAQQLSTFKLKASNISFITPNTVTLFYNKSWKEYEKGQQLYKEVIAVHIQKNGAYDVPTQALSKLYDYLEHIQTSVILIYSALEALCNVAIPNEYSFTKKNNKGITEIWDKKAIEKWLSTEEKVGKLIPEILGIDSPKQLHLWERFKKLKQIRDNIIHQKQSTDDPSNVESTFLNALLQEAIFPTIMAGFELIQFFCEKDKTHLYFPILANETPVNVTIVESFNSSFSFTSPADK